jgi:hypothetical protein
MTTRPSGLVGVQPQPGVRFGPNHALLRHPHGHCSKVRSQNRTGIGPESGFSAFTTHFNYPKVRCRTIDQTQAGMGTTQGYRFRSGTGLPTRS